jgi:hypothetical protein
LVLPHKAENLLNVQFGTGSFAHRPGECGICRNSFQATDLSAATFLAPTIHRNMPKLTSQVVLAVQKPSVHHRSSTKTSVRPNHDEIIQPSRSSMRALSQACASNLMNKNRFDFKNLTYIEARRLPLGNVEIWRQQDALVFVVDPARHAYPHSQSRDIPCLHQVLSALQDSRQKVGVLAGGREAIDAILVYLTVQSGGQHAAGSHVNNGSKHLRVSAA